jgi:hypothetical protein
VCISRRIKAYVTMIHGGNFKKKKRKSHITVTFTGTEELWIVNIEFVSWHPSVMWNVTILCLCKINYPWVQVYFQHRNRMKSGMRVLFPIRLDVTHAAKYINGNKIPCIMLLKSSLHCPVTGLQLQAGTARFHLPKKHRPSLGRDPFRFLCRGCYGLLYQGKMTSMWSWSLSSAKIELHHTPYMPSWETGGLRMYSYAQTLLHY